VAGLMRLPNDLFRLLQPKRFPINTNLRSLIIFPNICSNEIYKDFIHEYYRCVGGKYAQAQMHRGRC
jgi:hypothetical protein